MLIVLSPAKKLSIKGPKLPEFTFPGSTKQSSILIKELRKYSPTKLSKLMKVSSEIALINVDRYNDWSFEHSIENSKQAILTFNGEVYNGLKASSFNPKEMQYAQQYLRILSGLYGVLKPLDLIQEYRLEMGTKLKVGKHQNLYNFWGDKLVNEINSTGEKVLINLASAEYFKVINSKKLKPNVVTPIFKECKNGEYKMVMMYAKKARGMMAKYIIKNKLTSPKDLLGFAEDGYYYNSKVSTDNELVFYRG